MISRTIFLFVILAVAAAAPVVDAQSGRQLQDLGSFFPTVVSLTSDLITDVLALISEFISDIIANIPPIFTTIWNLMQACAN